MFEDKIINIMGVDYMVVYKNYNEDPDFKAREACGFCDSITKVISICRIKTNPEFYNVSSEYVTNLTKEILRHEIFHAFLYESGLAEDSSVTDTGWAVNEEIIDWFAIQSPKIYTVFKQLDIL